MASCPRFPLTSNGEVEEAGAPTEEGLEVEDSDSGDRLCWLRTEADPPAGSAEGEGIARSRSASPSVVWIEELESVLGSGAERLLGDTLGAGTSAMLRQGDVKNAAMDKETAKDKGLSATTMANELRRMSLARVLVSNFCNLEYFMAFALRIKSVAREPLKNFPL